LSSRRGHPRRWCALTAPFHPYLCGALSGAAIGGLFSVALSCGSPRLGVAQHPALWSPDVPRPGHLSGPDAAIRPTLYAGFCTEPCGPVMAIPLGRRLPAGSCGLPEGLAGGQPIPSARPCSGWGLSSRRGHPRRWCALTAPFHPYLCGPSSHGVAEPPSAVCSLWHFPAGRPDWVLPSTLPCGVRTFLGRVPCGPGRGHPADSVPCLAAR
jgi:hypothetical protein